MHDWQQDSTNHGSQTVKRVVCVTAFCDHDAAEGVSLPGQVSSVAQSQSQPRRSSTPWTDTNRISMPVDDSDDINFD